MNERITQNVPTEQNQTFSISYQRNVPTEQMNWIAK